MSIVRIGLAETKKFAQGYAAIFGTKKKKDEQEKPSEEGKQEGKRDAKAAKKKDKK